MRLAIPTHRTQIIGMDEPRPPKTRHPAIRYCLLGLGWLLIALTPVIVLVTFGLASMILLESSLSFLGLGVQPPTASLGTMLQDGYQVQQQAWWADVFPGLAIALAVAGFLLLGDGLRRRLDPRGIAS